MKFPLLNFVRGPEFPLLNFEGGPGVPLLHHAAIDYQVNFGFPIGENSLFSACYRDAGRKNSRKRLIFNLINQLLCLKEPFTKSISDDQIRRNKNQALSKLLALFSAYQLLLKEN